MIICVGADPSLRVAECCVGVLGVCFEGVTECEEFCNCGIN